MSALGDELKRVEVLAQIICEATKKGILLPTLGSVKCLPSENGTLLTYDQCLNVELIIDQSSAEEINDHTECISGVIRTKVEKRRFNGSKETGFVWL